MSSSLGLQLSEHRVKPGAPAQPLFAAVAGVGFMGWLLWLGPVTEKLAIGALIMSIAAVYMVSLSIRMATLRVALHERGIRVGDRDLPWESVLRGELRYVPGVGKQGTANEKNCVSLVLVVAEERHSLTQKLEGFAEIVAAVRARASCGVEKVLVGSLFDQ